MGSHLLAIASKALEQEIIQSRSHIDSDLLERLITTVFSPHKCAPVSNGTQLIVQIVRLTSVGNARSKAGVLNWSSCFYLFLSLTISWPLYIYLYI